MVPRNGLGGGIQRTGITTFTSLLMTIWDSYPYQGSLLFSNFTHAAPSYELIYISFETSTTVSSLSYTPQSYIIVCKHIALPGMLLRWRHRSYPRSRGWVTLPTSRAILSR